MSEAVKRHLLRCAGCREFAGLAEETGRQLAREAEAMLGLGDPALAERVKALLRDEPEPSAIPQGVSRGSANWGIDNQVPSFRGPVFRLRPVLTATVALVVVGAGVLYVVTSRPQQASPGLTPPFQIEQPGKYLVAAVERVNSPYEQEIRLWRETLDGAARKIESALDIGLE
jgi:hypothetical protein